MKKCTEIVKQAVRDKGKNSRLPNSTEELAVDDGGFFSGFATNSANKQKSSKTTQQLTTSNEVILDPELSAQQCRNKIALLVKQHAETNKPKATSTASVGKHQTAQHRRFSKKH